MTIPLNESGWRARLDAWIERPRVQNTLIALIIMNAIILGLETSQTVMACCGSWLIALDHAILAVFVVEILLRIVVRRTAFFHDAWSVFDFFVVAIALVPSAGAFAVLRTLRVLRVLRLLTMVPSMRRVVAGLLSAIPGLASVVAIICVFFFVGSVIATKLFSSSFPDWFGTLGKSAYSLFQIMTLESWSMGIVRPVMEKYPYAWGFFIPFIMISTFTMLNLFIAVIVSAIQSFEQPLAENTQQVVMARVDADAQSLHEEIVSLRREVAELKNLLVQPPGSRLKQ